MSFRGLVLRVGFVLVLFTNMALAAGETGNGGDSAAVAFMDSCYQSIKASFAQVKVKNARHGPANPYARYRGDNLTVEEVSPHPWWLTRYVCWRSAPPRTAVRPWS